MPEGDTLHRTATGLAPHLVGRPVTAARVRPGGPQVQRVVGATVTSVEAVGKNLLIRFDNGLELRTHLRMTGSWHRYRPGERWRRPAARARLVLEVPGAVAVCFDAPVVELFETRAEAIHPTLSRLGPDLLAPDWGPDQAAEARRRLRDPARAGMTISEALLDQRVVAGIGNIWRNETLFHERVDPWASVGDLDGLTVDRLVATARDLLRRSAGVTPGRSSTWVYRRAGRPCRRCGTLVRSAPLGSAIPRTTYWCPSCQPEAAR
ncbi:MAG TPA: DNA-formamidopyrimidine glycosylase family protein [Verrucomicrobiae bacterium]|jgi:endonuclease-8|nr:DNA-formamidopyrimidine glycosylase family protein [Verrucomicrobiae bacterium]